MIKDTLMRNIFNLHLKVVRVSHSRILNGIEFQVVAAENVSARNATYTVSKNNATLYSTITLTFRHYFTSGNKNEYSTIPGNILM